MKGMILAAGIGSRLRPLTDARPKALIEVGGVPMIEIVIGRLIAAGVDALAVNVFHHADMIAEFLKAKRHFGIRIEISRETELLDTGGGLKKTAAFFDDGRPFFVHNVDEFSEIDLGEMYRFHEEKGGLAALAVQERESGRYFLFDQEGLLRGWQSPSEGRTEWAGAPAEKARRLAFDGIHVVSPEIFSKMTETGVFSINRTYLRLAGMGEKIRAFRSDAYYCRDIGRPEKLEEARRRAGEKGAPLG